MMFKTIAIGATMTSAAMAQRTLYLFADGGYQSEPVECMETWTYKEKLEDGTNVMTEVNGCANLSELKPYPYFDGDVSEIANLLAPTDSRTDTTKWCAIERDVYNPTPQNQPENKFNWGYCLDVRTDAPVTSQPETPTPAPTTKATTRTPTPEPTPFPIEPGTTSAPTEGVHVTAAPTKSTNPPVAAPIGVDPSNSDSTTTVGGLDQWTIIGIALAGALLLAAAVMGAALAVKFRKSKGEEVVDEEVEEHGDIEESTNMERS